MFNELFGNDSFMSEIMQSVMQMYGVMLICCVLVLIFKVLYILSIGYDCKSRGDQKQAMWMILCFFFPLIAGIAYACTRNKNTYAGNKICPNCGAMLDAPYSFCPNCGSMNLAYKEPDDSAKNKKTSKTLFGVSVVFYVLAIIAYLVFLFTALSVVFDSVDTAYDGLKSQFDTESHYGYLVDGEIVYYDREGNYYLDDDDVLYYDRNGATYTFDDDELIFESLETGKSYGNGYSYVDEEGYFIFDAAGDQDDFNSMINYDANKDAFCDQDGNIYYFADEVSWDSEGNMVDNYYGEPLN